MKKYTFLAFLILLLPGISYAQIYFGSTVAASLGGSINASAKNWEAIEVNPSNLGWSDNHTFSFSIANVGLNFADNGLNLASSSVITELKHVDTQSVITPTERTQMYNAVTAPGGLNISSTINWASFSFTIPKIGGFAFSLTDKIYSHIQLSNNAARLLDDLSAVKDTNQLKALALQDAALLAQNSAQIADGTNAGGYHYREITINYGRRLFSIPTHTTGTGGASFENSEFLDTSKTANVINNPIQIFGGIAFKPIWGLGSYSSVVTGGENIEEGTYVYNSNYMQNLFSDMFHANGRGYGVDLGLSATFKKWTVGFSATDIGQITWHNNSFQPLAIRFPPIDSITSILANNGKLFNYFVRHNASNTGGAPDYTTQLPTQFRAGISYKFSKLLTFSSDYVAPLNNVQGNLLNPYYSIGANINIFRWIGFGVGYATEKDFGNLVPVGLFVNVLYGFEVYVGTNDALAYLNPNGHVLSGSAGIKIFGF
jgi:hypothetical protein